MTKTKNKQKNKTKKPLVSVYFLIFYILKYNPCNKLAVTGNISRVLLFFLTFTFTITVHANII